MEDFYNLGYTIPILCEIKFQMMMVLFCAALWVIVFCIFTCNCPSNVMTVFTNVNLAFQYDNES